MERPPSHSFITMTLRATYPYEEFDKRTDTKSECYNNTYHNSDYYRQNDKENLEDYGKDTCIDAEKNSKSHDYICLMVTDMFLKLAYL